MDENTFDILMIEDDEDDYFVVKTLLSKIRSTSYRLEWASTYEEGITAVCGNPFDACLLDYRLGERNGLELLREAMSKGCDVPIILLTGQGDYDLDLKAMESGAADYLVKGLINQDLLERSIRYSIVRRQTERALRNARDELEIRVRERTADLAEANRALTDSEERYRMLIDSALDIIYSISADRVIEGVNPAFEQVTGWSEKDWVDREFPEIIHPDDLPRMLDRLKRMENGERLPSAEARTLTKSGAYIVLEFKTVARMRKGKVTGFIGTARDVTERKRMEEALRSAKNELELRVWERTAELARANVALKKNEQRLEALWELSQISTASEKEIADFVLNRQVGITESKFGSLGLLNENETEFTLQAWSKEVVRECAVYFAHTRFPVAEAGLWADAVKRRQPLVVNDYKGVPTLMDGCPPGHIELNRLLIVPVVAGGKVVAVAMVANKETDYDEADVRQISLLMDGMWRLIERERARRALRESENLAAMGRALASVAHDIKTPLISIGGFTKMVQRHLDPASRDFANLGIVLGETERLENMVKDMLDFSKPLELHKSPQDVCGIVRETLALLAGVAKEMGVVLTARLPAGEGRVPIDAMRMKQVLLNLVMNAIQASPRGQTVTVLLRIKDQGVIFDVVDCGCGIPFDKRPEIFSPFFTTKKTGTGLGLSIVKKIVEAHQGHVEVLDNTDAGLTFRVVLPLAA